MNRQGVMAEVSYTRRVVTVGGESLAGRQQ